MTTTTTDTIYVLVMDESDGDSIYYEIPQHWYEWASLPYSPPPDDLLAAYGAEYELENGTIGEFTFRTRQALAVDSGYIGASLSDVIARADGRRVVEIHGTFY